MHIPDQMPLVVPSIYAIVRVQQFDCQHRRILPTHGDRPGIGLRLLARVLLWVIDDDAFQRAVVVQRNESRPVLLPAALRDQKGGAVVRRLRRAGIPKPDVGRDRFPDALQRHCVGHVEVPGEEVIATRGIDDAASGLPRRVEGLLKGRRVVRLAVTLGAEIADGVGVSIRCRASQSRPAEQEEREQKTGIEAPPPPRRSARSRRAKALLIWLHTPVPGSFYLRLPRLAAATLLKSIFTTSRSYVISPLTSISTSVV